MSAYAYLKLVVAYGLICIGIASHISIRARLRSNHKCLYNIASLLSAIVQERIDLIELD